MEEPGFQSLRSMLEPLCPATPLWQRPRFYISRCPVQRLTQQAPQVYAVTLLTSYYCPSPPSHSSLLSLNMPNTYPPQGHCICCSAASSSLSPGNWKACSLSAFQPCLKHRLLCTLFKIAKPALQYPLPSDAIHVTHLLLFISCLPTNTRM